MLIDKVIKRGLQRAAGALALFLSVGVSIAQAAVPVEDMSTRDIRGDAQSITSPQPTTPQPVLPDELALQPSQPAAASGSTPPPQSASQNAAALRPGQNAQMFYELQQLQSELLQLRGLIEDQAFEIKRLRDLQRSQYLDIDRRLTGQGAGPASASASPEPERLAQSVPSQTVRPSASAVVTPRPIVETAPAVVPAEKGQPSVVVETGSQRVASTAPATQAPVSEAQTVAPSEQAAYTEAFELMKDQQFEQSIVAYQKVIENFPDGSFAPESRYWLGELYLMSDRLEDARGAFNQVVDNFPAHQKVPLSLYKLGVVNHRLGGTPKALEYLDDVVVRYPDTPAAGLARTYAQELR